MDRSTDLYRGGLVHLYTHLGTIVYFDLDANVVRHGPAHLHRAAAVTLVSCGSPTEDSPLSLLVAKSARGLSALALRDVEIGDAEDAAACVFQFSQANSSFVYLKASGRYLCAEPNGAITLTRDRPSGWERFAISFPNPAERQALAPLPPDLTALVARTRALVRVDPEAFISRRVGAGRRAAVSDMSALETYLVHETYHYVRLLHEQHGFDIVDSQRSLLGDPYTIAALNEYELVFLCHQGRGDFPINLFKTFRVLRIDDLENYDDEFTAWLKQLSNYSDLLVSPYAYELGKFFPHPNLGWTPQSSAIEHEGGLLPFNNDPIKKVLASGSVAADRPFRKYVFELEDDRIAKLGHPGYLGKYNEQSQDIVKDKWYLELNRYLAAFCDGHSLRYIHCRVFEIASTGALLIADRLVEPEMNQLGMVDGETCVFADQSDFLAKVSWVLDDVNRGEVDRIRRAGMNLTLEKHLTRHRVAEAVKLLEERLPPRASALGLGVRL
jgi:hypothetical protein